LLPAWLHVPGDLTSDAAGYLLLLSVFPAALLTIARHLHCSAATSLFIVMAIFYLLALCLLEVQSGQKLTWLGNEMLRSDRGREVGLLAFAIGGSLIFGFGYFFLQKRRKF
jgi:hypothetical protein